MVGFDGMNSSGNDEFPATVFQKKLISDIMKQDMRMGDTWYILDAKWYRKFKSFVGMDNQGQHGNVMNPGPIDNSVLLDSSGTLKTELIDQLDYTIVPATAWNLLVKWYGLKEEQHPIERKVINVAQEPNNEPQLEIYMINLNLYDNSELKNPFSYSFSKGDKISKIEEICRKQFNVASEAQVKLYCYYLPNQPHVLDPTRLVYQESLHQNHDIVMEVINDDSTPKNFTKPALPKNKNVAAGLRRATVVTSQPTGTMRTTRLATATGSSLSSEGRGDPCTPGLSGLVNLGNTCFLNSIIQCLSNCKPVTEYFLGGLHKDEVNHTNPLGNNGLIANSFADVISTMWSGNHSLVVPQNFKMQLTKFAPQFAGYCQHDAQELLTFLLDGLHEDLNRIQKKPYYQDDDSETEQDDEVLAQKSWEYFHQRNDSIIIDTFHGMLKSRVVCPDCEKVSIKFDTFSTISLPLPMHIDRKIKVCHVPFDQNRKITTYTLKVPKSCTISDMSEQLSKLTSVQPKDMVYAEVSKSHFHRFFSMDEPIESIDDRDKIYMYDIPADRYTPRIVLPVVLQEVNSDRSTHFLSTLFGTPFVLPLPYGTITYKQLYANVSECLTRTCELFSKNNSEDQSMECESPEDELLKPKNLFTPVLVDTHAYSTYQRFGEHDELSLQENFGQKLLALEVSRDIRLKYFKPVPEEVHDSSWKTPRPLVQPTLDNCLNLFTSTEKLGENNTWYCPRCRQMKRATKKLDLWKLPNILVIHLKRFEFSEYRKEKLETNVKFPLDGLTVDQYVVNSHKENVVYDLIGVCNHYGSLMGGHYTAFCKNSTEGKWYCFDDNKVTPITPESVQSENAYLLFYQRRPVEKPES